MDEQNDTPRGTRLTSIRISWEGWALVQEEADRLGISAAEYIREATFFRLGIDWVKHHNDDEVVERLRRLARHVNVDA